MNSIDRANAEVAKLDLPPAVFKTCPWQPRELVDKGLRQWLRCCAAALHDKQVVGMPSHAVDEEWHGFILCTARYSAFCDKAYGRFLHHHPEGGERCVLWDLDNRVDVEEPWGIDPARVADIEADLARITQRV